MVRGITKHACSKDKEATFNESLTIPNVYAPVSAMRVTFSDKEGNLLSRKKFNYNMPVYINIEYFCDTKEEIENE
jgi:hypothetical protein